jgi:hypothetical protein
MTTNTVNCSISLPIGPFGRCIPVDGKCFTWRKTAIQRGFVLVSTSNDVNNWDKTITVKNMISGKEVVKPILLSWLAHHGKEGVGKKIWTHNKKRITVSPAFDKSISIRDRLLCSWCLRTPSSVCYRDRRQSQHRHQHTNNHTTTSRYTTWLCLQFFFCFVSLPRASSHARPRVELFFWSIFRAPAARARGFLAAA